MRCIEYKLFFMKEVFFKDFEKEYIYTYIFVILIYFLNYDIFKNINWRLNLYKRYFRIFINRF